MPKSALGIAGDCLSAVQGKGLAKGQGSVWDIASPPWGVSLLQWGNNCRVPGSVEDTGALWQSPWTLEGLLTWSVAAKFRREGRAVWPQDKKTVVPAWPYTFSEGVASLPWGGGSPPSQHSQLALAPPSQHTQLALPPSEWHPCESGESTSLGSR